MNYNKTKYAVKQNKVKYNNKMYINGKEIIK